MLRLRLKELLHLMFLRVHRLSVPMFLAYAYFQNLLASWTIYSVAVINYVHGVGLLKSTTCVLAAIVAHPSSGRRQPFYASTCKKIEGAPNLARVKANNTTKIAQVSEVTLDFVWTTA